MLKIICGLQLFLDKDLPVGTEMKKSLSIFQNTQMSRKIYQKATQVFCRKKMAGTGWGLLFTDYFIIISKRMK